MTQIPSTQIYGIGIGSASTSPFITHFIGRSPTTSDINYSIQSRWVNTVTSDEYILQSFSTVAGVTTANWVNLATGSVDLLTFNANSGSAVPASAVINLVGTGAISTSASVQALKKVDFPAEGLPTSPINILHLHKYLKQILGKNSVFESFVNKSLFLVNISKNFSG